MTAQAFENGLSAGCWVTMIMNLQTDVPNEPGREGEEALPTVPNTVARRLANALRRPARTVCRTVARLGEARTIILLYHSIGNAKDAVRPSAFAEQMRYLKEEATVVRLDEIVRVGDGKSTSKPLTCVITFDDGYAGVYEVAYQILRQYGFAATVYVTTAAMGESEPGSSDDFAGLFPGDRTMTWRQVREMSEHGISIGSHLCHHKDMTTLDVREGMIELIRSKATIAGRVGMPCPHFAYPFGLFNSENAEWVRNAGYETATTVVHATVKRRIDAMRIPRMCVASIHDIDDFVAIVRGEFDYLPIVQKARRLLKLRYSL
ncbi:MAG: polysaccharide deacetylase family protein [Candidatus Binataceae bacterium]